MCVSEVFNVGRAAHWVFADGLGVNPKVDPETNGLAILILRQVACFPFTGEMCAFSIRNFLDVKK